MTDLLFVPNAHMLAWISIPAAAGPGADRQALLRCIASGDWKLPAALAVRLRIPAGLRLRTLDAGVLILVFPDRPLTEPAAPRLPVISPEQRRLLELLNRGLTRDQAACRLGRSPRWVRYQLARVRQLSGAPAAPGLPARIKRKPALKG